MTSSWLTSKGYDLDLQARYKKSNWLESIGQGAMIRKGDEINYLGGIYALQKQLGMTIHPGGKSALALSGRSHYIMFRPSTQIVIGSEKELPPSWFRNFNWGVKLNYHSTGFLPSTLGMQNLEHKGFNLQISNVSRAMMESLHLSPKEMDLLECAQVMEGMNNLRPKDIMPLLEACTSVKVKRLFLYLAKKFNHQWYKHLDTSNVELGSGNRAIVTGGTYIPDFGIVVPKEVADYA